MLSEQIILSGITAADLVEVIRQTVQKEVQLLKAEQPEKLLSPSETCKIFQPSISKVTLAAWTKKGLLTEHRIGGRVFYKQSEVIEKLITLKRYRN